MGVEDLNHHAESPAPPLPLVSKLGLWFETCT